MDLRDNLIFSNQVGFVSNVMMDMDLMKILHNACHVQNNVNTIYAIWHVKILA